MNIGSSVQYFAKGGACFLKGTKISLSNGTSKSIEKIKPQDVVLTFNEKTRKVEYGVVGTVQVSLSEDYYIINKNLHVTSTHPMYVSKKLSGENPFIKQVCELRIGDLLVTDFGVKNVYSIEYVHPFSRVKVYNLINVEPNHNYYANNYLVHNKGSASGGHASSGGRSSSSSSSAKSSSTSSSSKSASTSSKSSNPAPKPSPAPTPKSGTSTAKPGSTVKTADGKTVKSSTVTPTNKAYSRPSGVVGDNGYQPRFSNGYTAPAGSVIYYRDNSFIDYLPWIYLFGHSNAAPANQTVTVVQPDGKQMTEKPTQQGVDGLAILNWIILIIIALAIIGGIVWLVNKKTNQSSKKATVL